MHNKLLQLMVVQLLLLTASHLVATHYSNQTGRTIRIENASAKKRNKKSFWSSYLAKRRGQVQQEEAINFIELENGLQGDLDNKQGDQITISSPGMSDQRKLFPTNNSFNYVITMNNYHKDFEQFDINHAGPEQDVKKEKIHQKKNKKRKVKKDQALDEGNSDE